MDPHRHSRSVVLIGGGIGMSPLMGILREWTSWRSASAPERSDGNTATMTVIQTAGEAHELAWRTETVGLQRELGPSALGVHFAATNSGASPRNSTSLFDAQQVHSERVDLGLLRAAAGRAGERAHDKTLDLPQSQDELVAATSAPLWFLCGPPQMIDEVSEQLVGELGVHPSRVRFERWW
jgi:ferredoxin-NADP reductase